MRAAAFVRNVMVGRNGLTRSVLLAAFQTAGAMSPRSYLSTGNVTFDAHDPYDKDLTSRLEAEIQAVIGRVEPIFVRSVDDLRHHVEKDPFAAYRRDDVHEYCVSFLPDNSQLTETLPLSSPRGDVIITHAKATDVFSVTRLIGGRPGTAGPLLERATGSKVTTRNWRTIERIVTQPEP